MEQNLQLGNNAKIAIIGAGAAGLIAAKNLRDIGLFQVEVFEETDTVGGTWVYQEEVATSYYFQSSMYRDLHTNLPKEIMGFLHFPFDDTFGVSSFPSHQVVLKYLVSFCKTFQLYELIRFHCSVKQISRFEYFGGFHWDLVLYNHGTQQVEQRRYDAVVVCNGHYTKPYIPEIPGADLFLRPIIHSHFYKSPEPFCKLRIAVLGAGNSGIDISYELSRMASKVSLCHRKCQIRKTIGKNLEECPTIESLEADGKILLADKSSLQVDILILCTGYEYDFPFLDSSCEVFVQDRVVLPLYRHLIHAKYPTMSFVGLPLRVLPFPLFDYQTRYLASIYSGKCTLPSCERMLVEQQEHLVDLDSKGCRKYYHLFAEKQWEYCRELADLANGPRLSVAVQRVYEDVSQFRKKEPEKYRRRKYIIFGKGPNDWRVFENDSDVTL
ncbi:Flavin-containing monooxygenase FMO GS-OX-like 3 [Galdieria sulphuraria]|uniref:Dimethylaniline monooxygenase (N-oxide forming) n=1 Tax=Galdieria sulphuraria TaxID=130081 RepID=M2XVN3_GALSU|nr:dimethylaniline monooxygenase (N-oxide forming) [Galdieria sulphuraria]EME27469.1 dimethylaniline monooxygenase (N-oxide forming) [Galdieria sulphuraria]GJD06476.1 Flavin-containing monooxygenase FMO GS-OX-like 3 [Galdieria sulphuraria]|eukprot:XP_005703989.1 dimethylaniline monooxygenase (N-oxide forming) [Galdieria sulphuraria]